MKRAPSMQRQEHRHQSFMRRSMEQRRVDGRLSQLPEPLMEQILFVLPLQDAVRVSTLSKTWHRLWNSLPTKRFSFDDHYQPPFLKSYYIDDEQPDPEIISSSEPPDQGRRQEELLKSMVDSLQYLREAPQKVRIRDFFLRLIFFRPQELHIDSTSYLEELTGLIARNYVQQLTISFVFDFWDESEWDRINPLPRTIFLVDSLCVLRLTGCKIPQFDGNNTNLPCLQELDFISCHVHKHALEELLAGCPFLVQFKLDSCSGLRRKLRIPNLGRLKNLTFGPLYTRGYCNLEIKATNVEFLQCSYDWKWNNLNQIACNSLNELRAIYVSEEGVRQLLAKFQLLETLTLCFPHRAPENLRIDATQHGLKKLMLRCNPLLPLTALEIKSSNLVSCFYSCWSLPSSFYMDTPSLQVLEFCSPMGTIFDKHDWFLNLKECLKQFDNKRLNLSVLITSLQWSFKLKQWREKSFCPNISIFNHLEIERVSSEECGHLAPLDGLLWSFRPKILSTADDTSSKFIKSLCKTLTESNNRPCEQKNESLSWWHHLMDVRIKIGNNNEEPKDLKVAMKEDLFEKLSNVKRFSSITFELIWQRRSSSRVSMRNPKYVD